MDAQAMERLFRLHRDAEARRDYDAVIETFTDDCYIETVALGIRREGREAARKAYVGYFTAFPDLAPDDQGLRTAMTTSSPGACSGARVAANGSAFPPSGESFAVPFTNVTRFENDRMQGESIYFDLATLCEQAGLPLEAIRSAAAAARD